MIAYELYYRNKKGEECLLGVLPERRKNAARITKQSVLKWGKMVLGHSLRANLNSVYFQRVEL
jgi:hypothetical protein